MEIVNFHYVQEEYDDGDVYIPRREVTLSHNQEEHGSLHDVVDSFKNFLGSVGYLQETIDRLVVQPFSPGEEEENL